MGKRGAKNDQKHGGNYEKGIKNGQDKQVESKPKQDSLSKAESTTITRDSLRLRRRFYRSSQNRDLLGPKMHDFRAIKNRW